MVLSRRTFSAIAGTAALGLSLSGSGGCGAYAAGKAPTVPTGPAPGPPAADHVAHTVGFDRYSMLIDGKRLVLWSGEVHPFRLPSPSLWRDVLQKLRAHGYNAISIYVSWNYHSPAPGTYDFTGVRDLDLFLRTAAETGLYVILRPGPYINAEVDAGGFPGWLTATKGTARTSDPTYLKYADEWLTAVNKIAVQHLYTKGNGTIVLYQLENEYANNVTSFLGRDYMAHLYAKVRADGIDVPLFHNDKGRNGYWAPGSFETDGESGRYLYAFDGYPSPFGQPPDWGCFGIGGTTGGSTASPQTPGFIAEFGGGWFDPWGGVEFGGKGYAESRRTRDAAYERRFYLTNLANGIKIHNIYMTFGGTSWGWLPAPIVYTSYDYGAALDEARQPTSKLIPMHQIGQLLHCVPDLAKLDRGNDVTVGVADAATGADAGIKAYHLVNPDTKAHFYVLRNDTSTEVVASVPLAGTNVPVPVPPLEARLLATGIALGRRTLRYSTAQPMLWLTAGRQDIAVFTGRSGEVTRTGLECASAPTVTVLEGSAGHSYANGVLRVDAQLSGLTRVLVEGGGISAPLLLLFADDETSGRLWRYDTPSGPVLVHGPALLRTATLSGTTVQLTGDTVKAADLEVWGPRGITEVIWNKGTLKTLATKSGSLRAEQQLPGVAAVQLPALTNWRRYAENPESAPDYGDSGWKVANKTSSYSITPVPAGQPVLFADDYGYHYGDVWYRGHFTDTGGAESVSLTYLSGAQGLLMAWLDGKALGTHRMPVPDKKTVRQGSWAATATFDVPDKVGPRVLSVLVRRMQHDEDGAAKDTHKVARGLAAVTFDGTSPAVTWRIRGEAAADPVRGPVNNGGLYGERRGWHLPGFADSGWKVVDFPRAERRQGVVWYRTDFRLAVDTAVDASIGLTLTDDPARAYRVQIFLNGWNMGQYINDVGPQHTFVLPNGLLRTRGLNTLALAVLSDGNTPAGPGEVKLTLLGSAAGGVPVTTVDSPGPATA
ncbi:MULTISPECIES: beta-galactosidase [unclassified Streptomyces]|uniref:beta-galactosidase n=1 Tax=unclassified Streptomyces TaxID=2593676 RepID=UPI002E80AFC2|nr:beta-galactosidase [Streptomyces sp. NBC_00589]WTI39466.1 beta-galactosidase [Streptomyces sp. NBC_00775]WUB26855.1 beta-galactosidase [Streptomyces sp. NBC_00589]